MTDRENDKEPIDPIHGGLGSDDPFWPLYLKEAEKYDDMLVGKWDKKMETLLLFATLFSAIVTAFVIESSHNLQPDNAAITATAIVEIVGILRNRTTNEQGAPLLQFPDEFQPTTNAYVVNFVWLRWDRTAPPCNQARIRQARFNNLIRWRTELVISALPVVMDAALALFLLGLLVFLHDLSYNIYVAALVITVITATFYFGTTVAPCFVSFCPYETAISSRKTWGFFYHLFLAVVTWILKPLHAFNFKAETDLLHFVPPCEKREVEMARNTVPDRLTGDALNWIILHSQKPGPRDVAICAIAMLDSKDALKQLGLNSPGILPKVIQSFTSCFIASGLKDGVAELEIQELIDINKASLHGQALTVLVNQALLVENDTEAALGDPDSVIDSATKEAVKIRFEHLGNLSIEKSPSIEVKIWALVGLSAWHDFIGYNRNRRFNQGKVVYELAKHLKWSLSSNLRNEVLRALTKEISYWDPTISTRNKKETLKYLINLIPEVPSELQPQLACMLAVLALNLNHGASYLAFPGSYNLPGISDMEPSDKAAETVMNYYAGKAERLTTDGLSLLLFALTGLMEYYEHCDFDDEAYQNMKKIAIQFQALDSLGKQYLIPITLSTGSGTETKSIDPRDYFVNTLLLYLKLPRTPQHSRHMDEVFSHLLKCINPKRQSRELVNYGSQIIPVVTQILIQTADIDLKTECLKTMISYWDSGPSLLYVRILLFYEVPTKLVQLIADQVNDPDKSQSENQSEGKGKCVARSSLSDNIFLPAVSEIFRRMGEQVQHFNDSDNERLASCMRSIIYVDLLWVFLDSLHMHDKLPAIHTQRNESGSSYNESNPNTIMLRGIRSYMEGASHQLSGEELLLKSMVAEYDKKQVENTLKHWPKSKFSTKKVIGASVEALVYEFHLLKSGQRFFMARRFGNFQQPGKCMK
ncbi:putative transmembrane protein, partial [Rhizoctonia solani 123E]